MRFQVTHLTTYTYDKPVFLEPHTIRLCPRPDPYQRVLDFGIEVEPQPSRLAAALDPQGNSIHHAWFSDLTPSLKVSVRFDVETLLTNPFDYILTDERLQKLPVAYPPEIDAVVLPYRQIGRGAGEQIDAFTQSIADDVEQQTIPFLTRLNEHIYEISDVEIREEGEAQPPEQTLATRKGACRDLTVLFMACCRSVGLASRFVSGYHEGDKDSDRHHMHAWAEVYLPGGGWRGFDPTHGLAVADRHIAVASGPMPDTAAPVSGSFRGTGAVARMEANVQVTVSGT